MDKFDVGLSNSSKNSLINKNRVSEGLSDHSFKYKKELKGNENNSQYDVGQLKNIVIEKSKKELLDNRDCIVKKDKDESSTYVNSDSYVGNEIRDIIHQDDKSLASNIASDLKQSTMISSSIVNTKGSGNTVHHNDKLTTKNVVDDFKRSVAIASTVANSTNNGSKASENKEVDNSLNVMSSSAALTVMAAYKAEEIIEKNKIVRKNDSSSINVSASKKGKSLREIRKNAKTKALGLVSSLDKNNTSSKKSQKKKESSKKNNDTSSSKKKKNNVSYMTQIPMKGNNKIFGFAMKPESSEENNLSSGIGEPTKAYAKKTAKDAGNMALRLGKETIKLIVHVLKLVVQMLASIMSSIGTVLLPILLIVIIVIVVIACIFALIGGIFGDTDKDGYSDVFSSANVAYREEIKKNAPLGTLEMSYDELRKIFTWMNDDNVYPIDDGGNRYVTSQYNLIRTDVEGHSVHYGVDFGSGVGTNVNLVAIADATVYKATWSNSYGNHVILKFLDGTYALYAHMNDFDIGTDDEGAKITLKEGDSVKAGGLLGHMGNTGNSTGPHLHLVLSTSPYGNENGSRYDFNDYVKSVWCPDFNYSYEYDYFENEKLEFKE